MANDGLRQAIGAALIHLSEKGIPIAPDILVSAMQQNIYLPFVPAKARWICAIPSVYKTYDYFLSELTRMVKNVYNGFSGGDFIDSMASLVNGQLTQAYNNAWIDEGYALPLPDYLAASLEAMVLGQFDFVDQYYRDIVDAKIDQTPIDPLLARVSLWANRYNEAYNEAIRLITVNSGGNLIWKLGQTEEHCHTCFNLNGIVARAIEWEQLGVRPQGAPNTRLECGGWRCDCSLEPTDQRRTRDAYGRIEEAIL